MEMRRVILCIKDFIRRRHSIKNEKALEEVSKLAADDAVVTILNAINEQDAQASIKAGVHLDKITEERSKRLEKHVIF